MHPEDELLIKQYLQGDEETVGQINRWIVGSASRWREALDSDWKNVLQEVHKKLCVLFRKADLDLEATLRTYVASIVSNTCIDIFRERKRRREVSLEENIGWLDGESDESGNEQRKQFSHKDVLNLLGRSQKTPDEELLEKESKLLLLQALDRASGKCRQVWQRILAEKSYKEISEELEMEQNAVRQRAYQCGKKIVDEMRKLMDGVGVTSTRQSRL